MYALLKEEEEEDERAAEGRERAERPREEYSLILTHPLFLLELLAAYTRLTIMHCYCSTPQAIATTDVYRNE